MSKGAEYIPDASVGGSTTFAGLTDTPDNYTGQALRRPRVNDGATGLEFDYDGVNAINVEEARSDIRSTTRAGYSTFDSQPGLQALLDNVGEFKTLYFPSNGRFNLNSKLITTKSIGQSLVCPNGYSEIANGGIELANLHTKIDGFYMPGTYTYGVKVNPGDVVSTPTKYPQATYQWEFVELSRLYISGKTYGVYNAQHMMHGQMFKVNIYGCTTGIYINMTDDTLDYGDWNLMKILVHQCTTGIHVIKTGGMRLTDSKIQLCNVGLLLEPTTAVNSLNHGAHGVYISNCTFEDSTNWDVEITAQVGVNSTKYPDHIFFAGAHFHKVLLDKCNYVSFTPGDLPEITPFTVQQNIEATNVMYIGFAGSKLRRTGAGTSFLDVGMNTTNGAYIQAGGVLTLIDSWGTKTLQQLWSGT